MILDLRMHDFVLYFTKKDAPNCHKISLVKSVFHRYARCMHAFLFMCSQSEWSSPIIKILIRTNWRFPHTNDCPFVSQLANLDKIVTFIYFIFSPQMFLFPHYSYHPQQDGETRLSLATAYIRKTAAFIVWPPGNYGSFVSFRAVMAHFIVS